MSDRNGILRLHLRDVYGNYLQGENVDILLRNRSLSHSPKVQGMDASKIIHIDGLYANFEGHYSIMIDPPSYLPVARFVQVKSGIGTELEIAFPIDPRKVSGVSFPEYVTLLDQTRRLLENSGEVLTCQGKRGADLYGALDDVRRAGLLNIVSKCAQTRLSNNATVLSYLQNIYELRGDRLFAAVPYELSEEIKNSISEDIFESVSGSMHHPPPGYHEAGSYKTFDNYANLQLTFFTNGHDWRADIDIDDVKGLGHVFQVLRNELTRRPTHPYDIHQLLIGFQSVDPGYKFQFETQV